MAWHDCDGTCLGDEQGCWLVAWLVEEKHIEG